MIELEHRGVVTILRMAAGRGNALNIEFGSALAAAVETVLRSPARAVVLTGKGSMFGAGVDLLSLLEGGADYVRRFLPVMQGGFEQIVRFPKPMVAAVNGHAIAGGAVIMLACDYRVLARGKARVGLTEVRVGVEFPPWALETVRFATPPQHFPMLVCNGLTYLPDEALARGLVDELVDPEQLIDRACAVAEELASVPASAFAATKLAVRRPWIEAAEQQSRLQDAALSEKWSAPEVLRNIAEFASRNISRGS
jgi:enoyl-CoA hydratase